jgi:hypothetical protein
MNVLPCKTCPVFAICKSDRVKFHDGIIVGYCSILYDYLFKSISKQRQRKRRRQVLNHFKFREW